ncbi:carboxylesterase family protein [Streptomyces sp. NPDC054802]
MRGLPRDCRAVSAPFLRRCTMSVLLSKCLARRRRRLSGKRRTGALYGALVLSIVATALVPAGVTTASASAGVATAVVPGASAAEGPTVTTRHGEVRGKAGQTANSYLGIPYAAPPVGSQRWRPPAAPERRHGVRDASTPGNPCMPSGPAPGGTTRDRARPARTACT